VKAILTLAFILSLSLTPFHAWPAYILFLSVVLSVASFSRLGLGFVLRRSVIALPFVLAAAPLILGGPPPRVGVQIFQGIEVFYSPEGAGRFASIMVRSWISVQAAILLAATTRFPDLLLAFRQLKVPRLFIGIVGLMWRYLFAISDEASRMLRARASRSAEPPDAHRVGGTLRWRAGVAGGMAGSLFLRSIERSDRVYAAMLSRGYNGELPRGDEMALSTRDWRILGLGCCLLVLLWILGLLTGV
jgi:cobalt/nickel transport system permease protein